MADVIYVGSGGPAAQQGTGFWTQTLKDLLPIGLVIAAAWLLWPSISAFLQGSGSTGGGTQGSSTTTNTFTNPAQANPLLSFMKAITTPGTYVNAGTSNVPAQGTGIGNLFVDTGPGTPANLFPLGNVISTSRPLTTQEQQQTIDNLAAQPFLGWWSTPDQVSAHLAALMPNAGTNTQGARQSNIPAGTTHTPCTSSDYASGLHGCRAPSGNDGGSTWY